MSKMTKSEAKKKCAEIVTKMYKLLGAEYATATDYEAVRKIINKVRNRAK